MQMGCGLNNPFIVFFAVVVVLLLVVVLLIATIALVTIVLDMVHDSPFWKSVFRKRHD